MMAEVCAPLAKLDGEDWLEHDYRLLSRTLGLFNTSNMSGGGGGDMYPYVGDKMDGGQGAAIGECANKVRRPDNAKNDSSGQSVPDNNTPPDVNSTLKCFRTEQRDVVDIIAEDILLNDSL